ncbi:hypothetical protein BOTNAR_0041g00010 [Botryotinia narcissicola]|uniref:Uncharacterized protein n=1 Tax=Botryotinia narcissicola TaxID=278944 RepID=A0A4Z1J2Q6_9HELO|nr:hypothetical protein BOTNAR_0041g00010 [Botryotinia narcissicola]
MSSPDLGPLAMSQTKDDLVKHLNISAETYTLMAKETDVVYRWLISEKCHLKKNCKGKPPYDWSDIVEISKDEAMKLIVQNGTDQTAYYWNLAKPTVDCPNWIARWFLYHKFRYRDGDSQGYDYSSTEPSSSTSGYATYSSSQTYTPSSSYVSYTSLPISRESGQTKPYDPVRDL